MFPGPIWTGAGPKDIAHDQRLLESRWQDFAKEIDYCTGFADIFVGITADCTQFSSRMIKSKDFDKGSKNQASYS